jgi:uncharacterized protein VirK/YbjX
MRARFRTLQTFGHHASFRAWNQLLKHPDLKALLQQRPELAYTYLVPSLAHGLARTTRLRIMHHHYAYWLEHAQNDFFTLVTCPRELWHCQVHNQRYSIVLAYPIECDIEGELALRFYADATCLYTLTFTFAPPRSIPGVESACVLVSRVQGTRHFDLIRQATKHLYECTPAILLLQALGGLSQACSILDLVGVGTRTQTYSYKNSHHFDYNQFWQQAGAELLHSTSAWYAMNWLTPDKPLSALKAHRRARTARKRLYKQQLSASVQHYVAQQLLHAGIEPIQIVTSEQEQVLISMY